MLPFQDATQLYLQAICKFWYLIHLFSLKKIGFHLSMLSKLDNLIAIDLFNILKANSIDTLKNYIPSLRYVNRYPFCFIARPRIGNMRKSVWGYKISDSFSK